MVAAAYAFGDVIAGELDVDAAGVGAERPVHLEEAGDLVQHVVEVPGLVPLATLTVLPCIGSQTHTTVAPLAATFSTRGGSAWRIRPAPIRVIRVRRPGWRSGSRASIRARTSCAVAAGPTLTATGLRIWRANSTWALPRARVRSPIHSR